MFTLKLKSLRSAFAALFVVFTPVAIVAPVASAQANSVVVYDQAEVLERSMAAQDIRNKLKTMGESTGQQLKPEGDSLETERTTIAQLVQGKTEAQIQADANLMSRINSFETRLNSYGQRAQRNLAELQKTEVVAWQEFGRELETVLQMVASERSASVVLEASAVGYVSPSADVTDRVITILNQRKPSVNVVRQTVTTTQQPG